MGGGRRRCRFLASHLHMQFTEAPAELESSEDEAPVMHKLNTSAIIH